MKLGKGETETRRYQVFVRSFHGSKFSTDFITVADELYSVRSFWRYKYRFGNEFEYEIDIEGPALPITSQTDFTANCENACIHGLEKRNIKERFTQIKTEGDKLHLSSRIMVLG